MSLAIALLVASFEPSTVHARSSYRSSPVAAAALTSASTQQLPPKSPTSSTGRVVATVSLEGLRIPAVSVELRSVDGNVVVAKTTTDVVGQVTFPDVRAGRYLVHATRDGFADADSAPFEVSGGEVEQVALSRSPGESRTFVHRDRNPRLSSRGSSPN